MSSTDTITNDVPKPETTGAPEATGEITPAMKRGGVLRKILGIIGAPLFLLLKSGRASVDNAIQSAEVPPDAIPTVKSIITPAEVTPEKTAA